MPLAETAGHGPCEGAWGGWLSSLPLVAAAKRCVGWLRARNQLHVTTCHSREGSHEGLVDWQQTGYSLCSGLYEGIGVEEAVAAQGNPAPPVVQAINVDVRRSSELGLDAPDLADLEAEPPVQVVLEVGTARAAAARSHRLASGSLLAEDSAVLRPGAQYP